MVSAARKDTIMKKNNLVAVTTGMAAGALAAVEQLDAERCFQLFDLLGQRGLRHI